MPANVAIETVLPEGSWNGTAGAASPLWLRSSVPIVSTITFSPSLWPAAGASALAAAVAFAADSGVAFACSGGETCLSQPPTSRPRIRSGTIVERKDMADASNAMWGGRFAEGPAAVMREINASIPFDKRLWRQDIAGSKAHVAMLGAQGIVSAEDATAIADGLDAVAAEYEARRRARGSGRSKTSTWRPRARLAELIGPAAGRLHTARSRNDQVATDFRLWVRDAIDQVEAGARRVPAGAGDARRGACRRASCPASPICRSRSR